jgi:thiamine pyrophosphate-dependent acetolactate synthase large subunit-like protein
MLERRSAVKALLADRGTLLLVTGLGSPTYDAFAAGDNPRNFHLWGAMGSSVMVGLGLALARPQEPVLVLTGDGELLMGLGSLATVAQHKPANLSIVVLDNEAYAETGGQSTATGHGVDLAAVAAASGLTNSETIRERARLTDLRQRLHASSGPLFAVLKITAEEQPRMLPMRDGVALKLRFRAAVLGEGPFS